MTMKFLETLMTPNMAAEYLLKNTKNRRLDMRHVKKLANDMSNKKWVLNGDMIRFNTIGDLIDGQHRLHAVILSGETVPMGIVYDIEDPDAFKTIDVGAKARGAGQVIAMMGMKNANTIGAISKRLIHWEKWQNKSEFTFSSLSFAEITQSEVIKYTEDNQDEIEFYFYEIYNSLAFKKCGSPTSLITALILCGRYDEKATQKFIDGIKTGINLQENSSIILLRDRLVSPPERRNRVWELELMALVIKSFNKFLYGKPLKTLRWTVKGPNTEKFPIPGEV